MAAVLHDAAPGHHHVHELVDPERVASLVTEVLEILLEHHELDAPVSSSVIASRLPVDPALVDAAIVRLLDEDTAELVGDASEERLQLSVDGVERAVTAVRRHRLTERLLSDVIG
ncbi:MAG: hypothetical protein EA340_14040, partial [Nitriliruptor sp.]